MALARLLILLLTAGCTSSAGLRVEPWPSSGGVSFINSSPASDRYGWSCVRIVITGRINPAEVA